MAGQGKRILWSLAGLALLISVFIMRRKHSSEMYVSVTGVTNTVVKAKNVIIMIPDGTSQDVITLTRWMQGGQSTALDALASGLVRTHNANTPIADSAPAASAYATGHKSHYDGISVLGYDPVMPYATTQGVSNRPVATLLEAARLQGKSTGLVVTVEIMHATPSAFSAHDPSRKAYDNLSEQQLFQGIDVVFGGGYSFFTPEGRDDKQNLIPLFSNFNYTLVTNRSQMLDYSGEQPIWGLFAPEALAYDIDRNPEQEPSLEEMSAKAIELLARNPKGFFLLIEGSKIDWASHANDPIGQISETLAFNKAVRVARDFAESNQNTVLVIMADHGNSGFSMGNTNTSHTYDTLSLQAFLDPLKKATHSSDYIAIQAVYHNQDVYTMLRDYQAISNLTPAERASIQQVLQEEPTSTNREDDLLGQRYALTTAIGHIIAARANLGYTTGGHTGEDVTLYSYLPGNKHLHGVLDNTDIGRYLERSLDMNLSNLTRELFVSDTEFSEQGIIMRAQSNRTLTLTKDGRSVTLVRNRSTVVQDSKTNSLPGVVVLSDGHWYVPQQALDMLQ